MIRHKSTAPEQYRIMHDKATIGTANKVITPANKEAGQKRKTSSFRLNCDAPGPLAGQVIESPTMKGLKIAVAEALGVKVDDKAPPSVRAAKTTETPLPTEPAPDTTSAEINLE
jgi:hypothetical protein